MGWRTADRLPELFAGAVAGLQPGEISEVLRSPAGFHILRLNRAARRGRALHGGAEPRPAHTGSYQRDGVPGRGAAQAACPAGAHRQRLEFRRARAAELRRRFRGSRAATSAGSIPGDTVPDFERAVKELKPMEVSQPVKTQFGWHLIQVLERRTTDASSERKRLEARKALRERKSDEAYPGMAAPAARPRLGRVSARGQVRRVKGDATGAPEPASLARSSPSPRASPQESVRISASRWPGTRFRARLVILGDRALLEERGKGCGQRG